MKSRSQLEKTGGGTLLSLCLQRFQAFTHAKNSRSALLSRQKETSRDTSLQAEGLAISFQASNEITTSQAPRNDKHAKSLLAEGKYAGENISRATSLRANVNERGNLRLNKNEITTGVNSEGISTHLNVSPRNDKQALSLRAGGKCTQGILTRATSLRANVNERGNLRLGNNEITTGVKSKGISTHPNVPPCNDKPSRLSPAFTLAEVLITLGIIGVVAAMTIPTIMTKIQNKQYQVAYRKAYSTLNQALKSMIDDGQFIDISDRTSTNKSTGPIGDNFKILATYFAGATYCFDGNADKCWECENGQAGRGYANKNNGKGCSKEMPAFIDASGMSYYLFASSEWPIIVDVNGMSGPNELGRDRYVVYFTNSRTKGYYDKDVDTVYPWRDITVKQRWCPSGDCPNNSRLFGNGGRSYNVDLDAGK